MDVALSRRVAMAVQHEADLEERDSVVEEARLVETWDDLPEDIQQLIEDLEDRPYREGVPYAWLGDPRETEKAWALEAGQPGLTASAVGHEEFCRNPLHPGPCRGWRRQIDVAPESRRDKGPDVTPTPRKRAAPAVPAPAKRAPAKKAAPAPDFLAEVPRMARPPTVQEAAQGTNPGYGTPGPRYQAAARRGQTWTTAMGPAPARSLDNNCTNVVHAFEMRMRGYDVTAAASPFLNGNGAGTGRPYFDMEYQLRRNFRMPGGRELPASRTFATQPWQPLSRAMDTVAVHWPEGARGAIWAGGHIFNVIKENGQVKLIEAQVPRRGVSRDVTARYVRSYARRSVKLVRLDDLEPAPGIIDAMVY